MITYKLYSMSYMNYKYTLQLVIKKTLFMLMITNILFVIYILQF